MKAPLGRGHEWITGHVLLTESIFEKGGLSRYYYAPVWTFNEPAENYFISKQGFKDKNNSSYYVSYPPMCFLAPYICFKLTGTAPSVTAIRVFGVVLHAVCAFLILLTVNAFFGKKLREHFFLPSLVAVAIYLFAAGNLWFHANIFFADTMEQLFAIWTIYLLTCLFKNKESRFTLKTLLLVGLVNFFGVYTEWLQVFIAFITCGVALLLCFRNKKYISLLMAMSLSTLLSLGLTFWQYNSIAGFDQLKKVQVEKYKQRSGRAENSEEYASTNNKESVVTVTQNYEKHYSHVMNLVYFSVLIIFAIFVFSSNKLNILKNTGHISLPLIILSVALLMHLVIFFNFNVIHDFGTLKCSTLFCLLIGIGMAVLMGFTKEFVPTFKYASILLFLAFTGYTVSESINRYYKNNNSSQITYLPSNIGEAVRKYAQPDELVFGRIVTPVTTYFAQRNVFEVVNLQDAKRFLKDIQYDKGIFIDADDPVTGLVRRVVRINSAGDSTVVVENFKPTVYTDPLTNK